MSFLSTGDLFNVDQADQKWMDDGRNEDLLVVFMPIMVGSEKDEGQQHFFTEETKKMACETLINEIALYQDAEAFSKPAATQSFHE